MYRMACKDPKIESSCRRLSCVYPGICDNLNTDHAPLIDLYRKARALPGIKKVLVASGLRYDLAVRSPEYVKELATHHVGGYLKIAPEHIAEGPLSKMMKPGVGSYDKFKALFDRFSREAGKEQYLIPYFIAAHPGTTDEDMLALALWLKHNGFRLDQVQTFLPTPLALATTMYHTGKNPLHKVSATSEDGERGARRPPAPPAQGLPALSRSGELAAAARGAAAHGPRRSDRQRQETPDSLVSAGGNRQGCRSGQACGSLAAALRLRAAARLRHSPAASQNTRAGRRTHSLSASHKPAGWRGLTRHSRCGHSRSCANPPLLR